MIKYQDFFLRKKRLLSLHHNVFCIGIPIHFLPRTFYLLTDCQNICNTFYDKLDAQMCQENISYTFKQL